MTILIAVDMEGASGVVHWDQTDPAHSEYGRFRELLTADVNAAVRGALAAGAQDVLVSDGHGSGRNVLIDRLDSRARLQYGSPSPLAMVTGCDDGVGAAFLVGYHAKAGTANAILSHTWSSRVTGVWLNGASVGEIALSAAVCAHFEVPVAMIAGDEAACSEAVALLGSMPTAVVKRARGRMAAECLAPARAQERIEAAASDAVRSLQNGAVPALYRPSFPARLEIGFAVPEQAERAAIMPRVERLDGCRIQVDVADAIELYRAFRAAVTLALG